MTKFKKAYLAISVIILLAFSASLIGCKTQELHINSPAPSFKLKDLNGQSVALSSFKGKTVLLHFWDISFQSCVDEMPFFQKLHEEWSRDGKVVLLTVDASNTAETIRAFMQQHNYTFRVLLDSNYATAGKYQVQYEPDSFLIDAAGIIKLNITGVFKSEEALKKQFQEFLP